MILRPNSKVRYIGGLNEADKMLTFEGKNPPIKLNKIYTVDEVTILPFDGVNKKVISLKEFPYVPGTEITVYYQVKNFEFISYGTERKRRKVRVNLKDVLESGMPILNNLN